MVKLNTVMVKARQNIHIHILHIELGDSDRSVVKVQV